MFVRQGRAVPSHPSTVGTPSAMVEYDGGIVLVGTGTAVTLRWDGRQRLLGNTVPLDFKISRDGRTMAAQEWWDGKNPYRKLHVFDLTGERTYALPWPPNLEFDVQILGADRHTVWFRCNGADLTWTVGDPAPKPAQEPPPVAGWEGPAAPRHPHYFSAEHGRTAAVGADGVLTVTDGGRSRTYPLPPGARRFGSATPVWESPDHLLLPVRQDPDLGDHLLRIDVTNGTWEIAANEQIYALTWPWPHHRPDAGPPRLPTTEHRSTLTAFADLQPTDAAALVRRAQPPGERDWQRGESFDDYVARLSRPMSPVERDAAWEATRRLADPPTYYLDAAEDPRHHPPELNENGDEIN
ncbi:hypothetical protein [Actinoplanes sp. NBRC 103695]|uniref:hypothetical protein n=1 Tax=Actinoplanes sp. NBRC 103695 TaxID=3032202 RepID=UPI00255516F8|nr:hypothetical protein [Actinoplanes sp. NBRC 103695]